MLIEFFTITEWYVKIFIHFTFCTDVSIFIVRRKEQRHKIENKENVLVVSMVSPSIQERVPQMTKDYVNSFKRSVFIEEPIYFFFFFVSLEVDAGRESPFIQSETFQNTWRLLLLFSSPWKLQLSGLHTKTRYPFDMNDSRFLSGDEHSV